MSDKPNIILMVWDTVRFDHLSICGYQYDTTPFLDSIRDQFICYENAFAQSHWTLPSFASMFTGLYPSEHGALRSSPYLAKDIPNIVEILKMEGYQTTAFSQNPYVDTSSGLDRGFDNFYGWKLFSDRPARERGNWLRYISKALRTLKIASPDWGSIWGSPIMVDAANRWLSNEWQTQKPFFMLFNFMDAHVPCRPPEEFRKKFNIPPLKSKDQWHLWKRIAFADQATTAQQQFWIGLYDSAIRYLDFQTHHLFKYWSDLGILDNTAIILLSDHGDNYGEHNLYSHTPCLYDSIIHVPLLVRLPGADNGNLTYQYQVELLDIFPTLLDIANSNNNSNSNGKSLLKSLSKPEQHRHVYTERFPIQEKELKRFTDINNQINTLWHLQYQSGVRTMQFKYIWSSETGDEFYDLRSDPLENNNLIESNLLEKNSLKRDLNKWTEQRKTRNKTISYSGKDSFDEEILIKRLEDLGYIS